MGLLGSTVRVSKGVPAMMAVEATLSPRSDYMRYAPEHTRSTIGQDVVL